MILLGHHLIFILSLSSSRRVFCFRRLSQECPNLFRGTVGKKKRKSQINNEKVERSPKQSTIWSTTKQSLNAEKIHGVQGGVEKIAPTATKKKGGGGANAPVLSEVCLRPSNAALLPVFSHKGPSNDCPCACFERFWLSDGCPRSFQARPVTWKRTVLLRNYRLRSSGLFWKSNFTLFLPMGR